MKKIKNEKSNAETSAMVSGDMLCNIVAFSGKVVQLLGWTRESSNA
jgi:hypothetical protein